MSVLKHILTFTLRNELFAVDAAAVKEIIWLPELTPIEESPASVAGVFNLHGRIVPVTDLNIRFGHPHERYHASDRVIVIECGMRSAEFKSKTQNPKSEIIEYGIIANDVHDVVAILERDVEPTLTLRPLHEEEGTTHLLAGEVKVGEEIIMLIDHTAIAEFGMRNMELKEAYSAFRTPHSAFTPEELAIFHERAKRLAESVRDIAPEGQAPLAVLRLNEELYGIDLRFVREFSDVYDTAPVPCTPAHIVGNINLRGEILTLIDIREMLNIEKHSVFGKKAVVASVNGIVAGIAVEDIVEVINISPSEIRHVPAAVEAVSNEYIKGEFPYQGKMLSILDLKKILTSKEMVVSEEI